MPTLAINLFNVELKTNVTIIRFYFNINLGDGDGGNFRNVHF
jgi:hypothetical protein